MLGVEHPETLSSAGNLAAVLSDQGKYIEAEQMLQPTLASLQRILGPAHPDTLLSARGLEIVRKHLRSTTPTTAALSGVQGLPLAMHSAEPAAISHSVQAHPPVTRSEPISTSPTSTSHFAH